MSNIDKPMHMGPCGAVPAGHLGSVRNRELAQVGRFSGDTDSRLVLLGVAKTGELGNGFASRLTRPEGQC